MDKYVTRPNQKDAPVPPSTSQIKQLKQATIESLRGVVVVEDIQRLRTILRVEHQTSDILLSTLNELNKKIPSRNVLKSTKIGHTVNRLTKHSDEDVAKNATSLVKQWKKHFEDKLSRPLLEVKSNRKTEELRKAAKKHLSTALHVPNSHSMVKLIEQEIFHQHGNLVGTAYRRTTRKIVFTLQHQPKVKEKVMSKTLQIPELVTQYKQLAKVS